MTATDTLTAATNNPQALLKANRDGIKANHIRTWEEETFKLGDKSVSGFTHTGEDEHFRSLAWLVPSVQAGALVMTLIFNAKTPAAEQQGLRGVFLGRFAEMLIGHFMQSMGEIRLTD